MNTDLFILPRGDNSSICTLKNGTILELAPLPFPGTSQFSMNGKWISCITRKGRRISLIKIENNEFKPFLTISLPTKEKAYTAAVTEIVSDTLFVGGYCGKEILGMYDLSCEKPEWIPLSVPEKITRRRKSIDDFIVDGTRLIAVDNIVHPKWLLLYNISKPHEPELKDYFKLENHGPNEQIEMGVKGLNWIALLSHTVGRSGSCDHTALLDKKYLKEYSVLQNSRSRDIKKSSNLHDINWFNVSFLADSLLVSSSNLGIGVLDLANIKKPRYALRKRENFDEQCQQGFFYCFPKNILGDSVLKIIPNTATNEIVVISQKSNELYSTVVSKDEL